MTGGQQNENEDKDSREQDGRADELMSGQGNAGRKWTER